MNEFSAAIGLIQLKKLDKMNKQRKNIAKIYSNEGLCQVLFFESDEECDISYKDKNGKYLKQVGITLPMIEK